MLNVKDMELLLLSRSDPEETDHLRPVFGLKCYYTKEGTGQLVTCHPGISGICRQFGTDFTCGYGNYTYLYTV